MYIEDINYWSYENLFDRVFEISDNEILDMFKKEINNNLNFINSLLNTDLKKMSNEDYYNLIKNIYNISLEDKDYLKIISKKMNKNCVRFSTINTTMTFTGIATEGRGRSFDHWDQLYQIKYDVAEFEDCKLKFNETLSKDKLRKMLDKKKIILIERHTVPIGDEPDFIEEKEEEFPVTWKCRGYEIENSEKEEFDIIVDLIRKKITKKRILEDLKGYIEELKDEINYAISFNCESDYPFYNISKLCNEWYNSSEEKEKLKELYKKTKI